MVINQGRNQQHWSIWSLTHITSPSWCQHFPAFPHIVSLRGTARLARVQQCELHTPDFLPGQRVLRSLTQWWGLFSTSGDLILSPTKMNKPIIAPIPIKFKPCKSFKLSLELVQSHEANMPGQVTCLSITAGRFDWLLRLTGFHSRTVGCWFCWLINSLLEIWFKNSKKHQPSSRYYTTGREHLLFYSCSN